MEDNYNQPPREKSFLSKIGDFFLNALIIIGSIVSVVGIATIFSNTVSDKIDKLTQDKDGKGGWGSWLRQKAGVSTTEQETSATDKIGQITDKAIKKGKKLFGFDTPSENQETTPPANTPPANDPPAPDKQKEGFGVSDAGAAALLLYGGKQAYNRLNPRVHVDKEGNIHSLSADQAKYEKAVEQATKDLEKAKIAQAKAQLEVDKAKIDKAMEDESNKKKRWYRLGDKTANKQYAKAAKALEAANESVTNLTGIIEDGNKVLSKGGQPSNSTRLRAYMAKLFGGGATAASAAGETEFGTIEPTTQKPAAPQTSPSASTKPTTVSAGGEYGDITTNPKPTAAGTAATPASPPQQNLTIKVGKTGLVEFTNTGAPKLPGVNAGEFGNITPTDPATIKSQAQQTASDETLKTKTAGEKTPQAGEPPTVKGKAGKAVGSLGIIAGTIATIRGDFENAKEHWNHKDEQGQPDRRGTALLQGVGTTIEVGSFIAAPFSGPFAPIVIAGGTASKEAISMGHEYVTGKPGGVTQSLISSVVEATGTEAGALAREVYNSTVSGEDAKALAKAELKRQHDKAVEEAMLKLSPEHKLAVDAWLQKAKEHGRSDIDPLILIGQVKDSNFRLPVNTPNPNALVRNDSQIGNK